MRRHQRHASAREWIRNGATATRRTYAKRYGVDCYTAYDDLTALGITMPPPAQRWAQRLPSIPHHATVDQDVSPDELGWITVEGQSLFVVGYTPGEVPYGVFDDEVHAQGDPGPSHRHAAHRPGRRCMTRLVSPPC
jgi:hypothetical protein